MIFNGFRHNTFNDSRKYFEVLKMAKPHIILWLSVIVRSLGGDKEQSIMSLIITSFVLTCLAPGKRPLSGEAMSLLSNCRVKHLI